MKCRESTLSKLRRITEVEPDLRQGRMVSLQGKDYAIDVVQPPVVILRELGTDINRQIGLVDLQQMIKQGYATLLSIQPLGGTQAEARDRYTDTLNRAGITSVNHAFRLLNAAEEGLRRFVAFVSWGADDEQIDVDATNRQQALEIAKKALGAIYQPGWKEIRIEGPITADMYYM